MEKAVPKLKVFPTAGDEGGVGASSASGLIVLALAAALVSIFHQGYEFGVSNHTFYLPPVLHLPELPQFANDPFYASLKYYVTFVWPALGMIANDQNVETVIFVAHVVARLVVFAAILYCLSKWGLRRSGLIVAALVFAATPIFTSASLVGRHGLFVTYFTHTELTQPFILMALVLAWRNRIGAAFALAGIAFNINAFVALWLCAALACGWLGRRWQAYRASPVDSLRDAVKIAACFVLPALPTIAWVVQAILHAPRVDLDFVTYLREYYPYHFLIDAASPWELGQLLCAMAITTFGLMRGGFERFWLHTYLTFVGLFAVGSVLPYVTSSRLLLDLHFLRVDGVIQLLSILVLLTCVMKEIGSGRLQDVSGRQLAALFSLASGQWYLIGAAFLIFFARQPTRRYWATVAAVTGLVAVAAVAWLLGTGRGLPRFPLYWLYLIAWLAILLVARAKLRIASSVPLAAVIAIVLIPPAVFHGARKLGGSAQPREQIAWRELVAWVGKHPQPGQYVVPAQGPQQQRDLQLLARVPVWVDWKRGATVMWWPSYYAVWKERYGALKEARTPDDLYRLACREGLPNVVVQSSARHTWPSAALEYQNSDFQVYRIQQPCSDVPVKSGIFRNRSRDTE